MYFALSVFHISKRGVEVSGMPDRDAFRKQFQKIKGDSQSLSAWDQQYRNETEKNAFLKMLAYLQDEDTVYEALCSLEILLHRGGKRLFQDGRSKYDQAVFDLGRTGDFYVNLYFKTMLDRLLTKAEEKFDFPPKVGDVTNEMKPSQFLDFITQGKPFNDPGADQNLKDGSIAHGAFTHRMQWYIIMFGLLKEGTAKEMPNLLETGMSLSQLVGRTGVIRGPQKDSDMDSLWADLFDRPKTDASPTDATIPESISLLLREGKFLNIIVAQQQAQPGNNSLSKYILTLYASYDDFWKSADIERSDRGFREWGYNLPDYLGFMVE